MATEVVTLAWSLTFNNSTLQAVWSEPGKAFDQSGMHIHDTVQDIGTAAAGEALVIPSDIGTNGFGFVENMDDTNYVEIGIQQGGTFYPLLHVKKNESFPLRWAQGVTPYARANTGVVKLRFGVAEN